MSGKPPVWPLIRNIQERQLQWMDIPLGNLWKYTIAEQVYNLVKWVNVMEVPFLMQWQLKSKSLIPGALQQLYRSISVKSVSCILMGWVFNVSSLKSGSSGRTPMSASVTWISGRSGTNWNGKAVFQKLKKNTKNRC